MLHVENLEGKISNRLKVWQLEKLSSFSFNHSKGRKWNVLNDFCSSLKLETIKNYSCNLSFSSVSTFEHRPQKPPKKHFPPPRKKRWESFFLVLPHEAVEWLWLGFFETKSKSREKFVDVDVLSWQQLANQIVLHLIEVSEGEKSHPPMERLVRNFSKHDVKMRCRKQCSSITN